MFEPRVSVVPRFASGGRVDAGLTIDGVTSLAPDAKVAAAGRKLGVPRSWESPGRSAEALWGECKGSAVYRVRIDLSVLAVKCSCPSRKHPCKHGIGLMFLHLETPLPEASAPDWVTDWLARRATRAAAKESVGERGKTAPDPEAKAERAQKRLSRVAAGLDALDLWMEDLVRDGLAAAGMKPASLWETQAKRMVDAQAPGVAARLRALSGVPNSLPDWPERLLGGLGRIALLSEAFRRLDALDEPLAESVRAEVGIPLSREEVLERGERVSDRWIVLGQRTEDEGRLKARRTWLLGSDTGRDALILQFAASGAPFVEGFVSGTVVEGELAFHPGAYPLRAVVRSRTGGRTRVEKLPGHATLAAFLDHTSTAPASQPWLERLPAALEGVVPVLNGGPSGGRWLVRDRDCEALPLAVGARIWPKDGAPSSLPSRRTRASTPSCAAGAAGSCSRPVSLTKRATTARRARALGGRPGARGRRVGRGRVARERPRATLSGRPLAGAGPLDLEPRPRGLHRHAPPRPPRLLGLRAPRETGDGRVKKLRDEQAGVTAPETDGVDHRRAAPTLPVLAQILGVQYDG